MTLRLDGKVIIITGAGGGIGSVTAQRLAAEGARVVLADVDIAAANRALARVTAVGGEARTAEVDVADSDSAKGLMDFAVAEFGQLDGLHNNAAQMAPDFLKLDGDLIETPHWVWQRTLDVDLTGCFNCIRHALPYLLQRGGSIVNTSSDGAFSADPGFVGYSVAKAGMLAITRHVASRWGKERIRCNAIAPGLIVSEASRARLDDRWFEDTLAKNKSWRLGDPTDVAAMVAMLMSEDGEWINGQTISINGGAMMR
ncbi:MAG: SDR family oxidoreductase [Acidimicrobiales bacterium]